MLPRRPPTSGLTLVELMFGIALLALLLALAVPSFQAQIAGSQLTSASEALMGSLMQARAQAIRLGRRVTVCRSVNLQQCDTDTSRGWEVGWLTFIDTDRSGAGNEAELSAADTLLARSEPLPASVRVRGNRAVNQYISFAASGEARTLSGGSNPLGTLQVCSTSATLPDARRAIDLVLSAGGRVVSRSAGSIAAQCPGP
jgi:type IV fimbrial biogenesis protein FimT